MLGIELAFDRCDHSFRWSIQPRRQLLVVWRVGWLFQHGHLTAQREHPFAQGLHLGSGTDRLAALPGLTAASTRRQPPVPSLQVPAGFTGEQLRAARRGQAEAQQPLRWLVDADRVGDGFSPGLRAGCKAGLGGQRAIGSS